MNWKHWLVSGAAAAIAPTVAVVASQPLTVMTAITAGLTFIVTMGAALMKGLPS